MRHTWSLALLSTIRITPHIAYVGLAPEFASDYRIKHPFFTWWEVMQGHAAVTTASGTWQAGKGEWMLLPHGVSRHQKLAPGTRLTSLSFRAHWPTGKPVFEFADPICGRACKRFVRDARDVCGEMMKSTRGGSDFLAEKEFSIRSWLRLRAALFQFLAGAIGEAESRGVMVQSQGWGDLRIDAMVSGLHRNLRIGPLPYAEWQRQFDLPRSSIDRLAQKHLLGSLRAHRDKLLEESLRREFILGLNSAKELAVRHGFYDQAHFTRWIKQRTGETPKQLRKRAV